MILSYGFLAGALILTSVGQLLYRFYYVKNNKLHLFLAIISLVIVPFCSYNALKYLTIDTLYMATSVTFILVILGGYLFLNEKLNQNQIIGSLIIIIGVFIYNS